MSRILLTGGAGFIGSALLRRLQAEGHDVLVYDDLSFGRRESISVPADRFVQADILDAERLKAVCAAFSPESVVHLAAVHFIPYCNEHPFQCARINLRGTANVLDAAAATGTTRQVFYASTAAVYPPSNEAIPETCRPEPMDIYGLSKLAGEYLCHRFHLATGCATIIGRFFNVFGPGETNPHLIPVIHDQVRAGARVIALGNLSPKRDFIHTSDLVDAVAGLLDRFREGMETFNIGSGTEHSVVEVVEAFAQAVGEEIVVTTDPSRIRPVDRPHLLADITKLSGWLDWRPRVSLAEGIRLLVRGG
jgi:UDP-glucose 4-epimerase